VPLVGRNEKEGKVSIPAEYKKMKEKKRGGVGRRTHGIGKSNKDNAGPGKIKQQGAERGVGGGGGKRTLSVRRRISPKKRKSNVSKSSAQKEKNERGRGVGFTKRKGCGHHGAKGLREPPVVLKRRKKRKGSNGKGEG